MRKSPTRMLLGLWSVVVLVGAVYHLSCGDDGGTPPRDAGVDFVIVDGQPADKSVDVAQDGLPADAPGLLDTMSTDAPAILTCGGIWTCFQSCGANCNGDTNCLLGCHSSCSAQGCQSAQTTWGALFGCTINSCTNECGTDPNSTACDTCVSDNCNAEKTACLADAC